MTTIIVSRKHRQIAADSYNTDSAGTAYLVDKIERIPGWGYYLGSGHLRPIGLIKRWIEDDMDEDSRPDLSFVGEDENDTYTFTCALVSEDMETIQLIDDELEWYTVKDEYIAIGSGGAYAIGALDGGLTPEVALACAAKRDPNTGPPLIVYDVP